MRQLRERPRLAVARVLALVALVGAGIAIGALLADPGPTGALQAEAQLKRVKAVSGERADRLDRTGAEVRRLQAELDEALGRTRSLARANSRLRGSVRDAKESLRRAQRSRRSRPR